MPDEPHLDPEDILDAAIPSLFNVPPIAFSTSTSSPFYTYHPPASTSLAPIRLRIPNPPSSVHQALQANHVWLSALYLADEISRNIVDLRDQRVAELGAGAGLPGVVGCRQGAQVVSSDWGAPEILDVIRQNFTEVCSSTSGQKRWDVVGHEWGTDPTPLLSALSSPTSDPTSASSESFDALLLADTLWVTEAHTALLDSIFALLRLGGTAHIVAGLHTGRGPVERFAAAATTRGARMIKQREVRWQSDGEWELVEEHHRQAGGLEEERGVVVYYTLHIPET